MFSIFTYQLDSGTSVAMTSNVLHICVRAARFNPNPTPVIFALIALLWLCVIAAENYPWR
jgi:hypothetical protein